MPSLVSDPLHGRETACHRRLLSQTQRQWEQPAQGSILIPMASTLSWQLTPREKVPDTATSQELHKGNPKIICMQGRDHSSFHPFTQAECAPRLGPKKPSASTASFKEPKENKNQLNGSEEREGSSPSHDVHTMPVPAPFANLFHFLKPLNTLSSSKWILGWKKWDSQINKAVFGKVGKATPVLISPFLSTHLSSSCTSSLQNQHSSHGWLCTKYPSVLPVTSKHLHAMQTGHRGNAEN